MMTPGPMKPIRWLALLIAALSLGCATSDYARGVPAEPALVLERFFDGITTAVGTVESRSGAVIRRFRARAEGSWSEEEQALTVRETWYWDDGEVEPRLWRWEKRGGGLWQGFEDDLVGDAMGRARGSQVRWSYSMAVDTNAYGQLTIAADDVMHLIDADNIINLVDMYYWGFYVGKVVLHIQRGEARSIEPFGPAPATL